MKTKSFRPQSPRTKRSHPKGKHKVHADFTRDINFSKVMQKYLKNTLDRTIENIAEHAYGHNSHGMLMCIWNKVILLVVAAASSIYSSDGVR